MFDGNPKTAKGFLGWIALGFLGGGIALVIGAFVPRLIPARAAQARL